MRDFQQCEWYLLCDSEAVGLVAHPILGDVPTCQRCADKLSLDLVLFPVDNEAS